MLLTQVVGLKQLRDLQSTAYPIYLQQVAQLKAQVAPEFAFLQETVDFSLLQGVQKPD